MRRLTYTLWYWLQKPPWDSGIPAPELVRAIEGRSQGNALDIGCGTGTNVRYLAEHGWQVTGIDFASNAIAKAKRKLKGLDATLRVGDVTKLEALSLPGPFDLALDMGCWHSLTPAGQRHYAAGLAHWLQPGGQYLLYAFQPDPARKVWGFPRQAVIETFSAGFTLVNYEQGQGRPSAWYYFTRR
jgi:SAM-dependent methyltransferase